MENNRYREEEKELEKQEETKVDESEKVTEIQSEKSEIDELVEDSEELEEELKKDQLPQILHVKDLQVLLSISHNTAYELVRSGKIRSIRIGRTYKIPLDAFNEYLRNG